MVQAGLHARRRCWEVVGSGHVLQAEPAGAPPSGPGVPVSSHLVHFVAQSCPTLCNPMDCSPPGSSVHGILQTGVLEWVAVPSARGSPSPGSNPHLLCFLCWQADSLPLHRCHFGSPKCKVVPVCLNASSVTSVVSDSLRPYGL